jgi:hypothetical protein
MIMDLERVRQAAEAHIQAIVSGDLDEAVSYVVEEGRAEVNRNLAQVVLTVTGAEIEGVHVTNQEAVVNFRVTTSNPEESEVRLETRWVEQEGRPLLYRGYQV